MLSDNVGKISDIIGKMSEIESKKNFENNQRNVRKYRKILANAAIIFSTDLGRRELVGPLEFIKAFYQVIRRKKNDEFDVNC